MIGLGYAGLPLLLAASQEGLGAIGHDISETRVAGLQSGVSPIEDVSDADLKEALASGATFHTDPGAFSAADVIAICVPSPLHRDGQPDLSFIVAAAATISDVARPGQLISLESTTYPGTTEEYIVPAVERAGLELDRDVWVAFSPERISPVGPVGFRDIPKIVGGVTQQSGEVAAAAYGRLVRSVHVVSSSRAAEMAKVLENTYRAVNIGLINEMAQLADALQIDIWEVIEAAATKPFGFEAFWPGPGVGGHCIPLDPQYLAWRARSADIATRFIDLADQVNSEMPSYNAHRIGELLNKSGRPLAGTKILAIGIAYKPNISDDRQSASLEVAEQLALADADVSVLDPVVGNERIAEHGYKAANAEDDFSGFAIAVVLTDHANLDYAAIADAVPIVYDARGVYRRLGIERTNVVVL